MNNNYYYWSAKSKETENTEINSEKFLVPPQNLWLVFFFLFE